MNKINSKRSLSVAIAASLLPFCALAQDSGAQRSESSGREEADLSLDQVVVSGTARSQGVRKRDASFSITTASQEEIQEAQPKSTADLLKIVPGLWVESTGGQTGANIDVRGFPGGGDAPFVTVQLDGSPLFPPPTLSFLENSSLFRIDETVERVEVLRGGPSPIFSNGQAGATVNFIQKRGEDFPESIARVSFGSGALRRVDLYNGGRLGGSDWYYSVGGFYRDSDGIRDPGFAVDEGGQLSATLTRRFDGGEVTFYGRHTDDRNVFYTAIPLVTDGSRVRSFPGISATDGTLIGPDFRRVTLPTGPGGQTITRDLADGRGIDITVFGGSLDFVFGDWTLSDRFNFLSGDAPTNGLFTGGNPQTLASFIADNYGTTGSGRFVTGGAAVDPEQQVLTAGWWVVDKDLSSFTNDLRFSRELFAGNTLTLGSYYAKYSSKDRWYLGNNMLLTAENQARRVDLTLDDGRIATRDGFVGTSFYNIFGDYDGRNTAVFVADEWQINDALRLDLGLRHERQSIDGIVIDPVGVDLDGDPNTLYDNNTSIATHPRSIDQDDNHTSWTVGLNYALNPAVSVFARVNTGFKFPAFDNLRDGQTNTQEIDQYELGLKSGSRLYDVYLTGFYNEFTGLPFQAFLEDGSNFTAIGDSRAYGLEFEGAVRPLDRLQIALTAVWMDAEFRNFGDNTGNRVHRQPRLQARLTPSYLWITPWADLKLFATYSHVGKRYSDIANGQLLPSYETLDVGATAYIGEAWELSLRGSNVTNEIGLTEGNARVIGGATSGSVFMGRPIEGRSIMLSLAYRR
jgi:outer membrane receptor protein involved in Fe transport